MPKAFLECVKKGGKVRTIKPKGRPDVYIKVCYINGKAYPGEVHYVKGAKKKSHLAEALEKEK